MRFCKTSDLAVWFFLMAFTPMLVCCREHREAFRVELPSGFAGDVSISCGSFSPSPGPAHVDATGHAEFAACPNAPTEVQVMRNGKALSTDGSLVWEKTGDNLPTGLKFNVR